MRYLLNSPVLTDYGDYRFEGPLSLADAQDFAAATTQSAIGHPATAEYLSAQLGRPVALQRSIIRMQPGDQALVLRLLDRLCEGQVLDAQALAAAPQEFALLTRIR